MTLTPLILKMLPYFFSGFEKINSIFNQMNKKGLTYCDPPPRNRVIGEDFVHKSRGQRYFKTCLGYVVLKMDS